MQAPSDPLHLTGTVGEKTIYNSNANISGTFNKAEVVYDSSEPKSFWVIYSVPNFDHDHPDDRQTEEIVQPNGVAVNMQSGIVSAQGFNIVKPGAVLFENSQYRGYGNLFQSSIPDLTDSFSQGKISGVSSIIITGGIWNFYTGFNYTGTKIAFSGITDLGPGQYNLGCLPANDLIKSMKYIRA